MKKGTVPRIIAGVALTCIFTTVLFVMTNGMPVFGAPDKRNVESVTVALPGEAGETYTDPEKIGLAVNLINALNYQPFTPVSEASREVGPDVTITYRLRDGRELTAAANWITGWWDGEARALKKPDMFVNLAAGVFSLRLGE